ncbi:hypothetical protein CISG_05969 [Coccidioides immitis RMSCC 3703]|uniref:Uncharacterized protein n=2 Tax=Coccidioides immitis TaxID=5501 RepID=A0A0J8TT04_COCIT|nr:hypothetical protein CIRG_09731 [Coccidioides immitis RMSCC 2394]KMU76927.1 hypothetical protein CISG_05969 [Coccidioides immitis RMSCC 3703]
MRPGTLKLNRRGSQCTLQARLSWDSRVGGGLAVGGIEALSSGDEPAAWVAVEWIGTGGSSHVDHPSVPCGWQSYVIRGDGMLRAKPPLVPPQPQTPSQRSCCCCRCGPIPVPVRLASTGYRG